jgi:protein-S-isoprenylcysteine O-methyltransferase Ste14
LRRLAAGLLLANAVLVAIRIRDEERLLRALPGWTEHFARKKRFIPGLV